MGKAIVGEQVALNWTREDIEQRCGFSGGRYTDVNIWFTGICALGLTVGSYALLYCFEKSYLGILFIQRGPTQHATLFLGYWALMILFVKHRKLALQRRALDLVVVPPTHDFVLAPGTAQDVMKAANSLVDSPKNFVLFCRIERALSNLSNIGNISDVSEILRSQAENDEASMESSFTMIKGFIWAIPVLGFVGTVMGLSAAIGQFGSVLTSGGDLSKLKDTLTGVTAGLSTAFDTTLVALLAALLVQLLLNAMKKKEEGFLDACKEYCHANIISRLRLIQLDR